MPQHARTTDPPTSHAAATVAGKSTAKEDVLRILRDAGPMHDEAIQQTHEALVARGEVAAKSPQRLRTARAELVDAGLVQEVMDGKRVRTVPLRSGYVSIVWEAVDA